MNLKLTADQLKSLLDERTALCPNQGRAGHEKLIEYRYAQEAKEEAIPRHDSSVYVCPFAGWIEPGRAGCLIHPLRTGRQDSQNASFYGAAICQSYNCRAKEKEDPDLSWRSLALQISSGDALIYSRIIGDAMLFRLIEAVGGEPAAMIATAEKQIEALIGLRLLQDSGPTSFELPMYSTPSTDDLISVLFSKDDQIQAKNIIKEVVDNL